MYILCPAALHGAFVPRAAWGRDNIVCRVTDPAGFASCGWIMSRAAWTTEGTTRPVRRRTKRENPIRNSMQRPMTSGSMRLKSLAHFGLTCRFTGSGLTVQNLRAAMRSWENGIFLSRSHKVKQACAASRWRKETNRESAWTISNLHR